MRYAPSTPGSSGDPATELLWFESKELVGGFWIWEVKSLEDAIQRVKRCPNPHGDGEFEIELRPFAGPSDYAS